MKMNVNQMRIELDALYESLYEVKEELKKKGVSSTQEINQSDDKKLSLVIEQQNIIANAIIELSKKGHVSNADLTAIANTLVKDINHTLNGAIKQSMENLITTNNKLFTGIEQRFVSLESILNNIVEKKDRNIYHHHKIDFTSRRVLYIVGSLFFTLLISLYLNYNLFKSNRKLKDNDLKYRTVQMWYEGKNENINHLDSVFIFDRKQAIKVYKNAVKEYEYNLQRKAQSRLLEDPGLTE